MKQITSEEFVVGKTIQRMINFEYSRKIFVFKDNTFAVYKSEDGEVEFVSEDEIVWNFKNFFRYGLITKKEHDKRKKVYDDRVLQNRRIQYEILKKEFEGK